MNVVITLVLIAALALGVLVWLMWRMAGSAAADPSAPAPASAPESELHSAPAQPGPESRASRQRLGQGAVPSPGDLLSNQEQLILQGTGLDGQKDVNFRPRGTQLIPGKGQVAVGDVMCSDGVYVPSVAEVDMHTSFDGRWLRTGAHAGQGALLIDRKSRRSWLLTPDQSQALDDVHWRLPRWNGENLNESGLADDAHIVMGDVMFEAWLNTHLGVSAQPLVALQDIWVPGVHVPPQLQHEPPPLPMPTSLPATLAASSPATPPSAAEVSANAPVADSQERVIAALSLQRYWPPSLRALPDPLAALQQPLWQLSLDGQATPWLLDAQHGCVWRDDAQAFALYAYPFPDTSHAALSHPADAQPQLVVWTREGGWKHWAENLPAERKVWAAFPARYQGESTPALCWHAGRVLQRMEIDRAQMERQFDGCHLQVGPLADSLEASSENACAASSRPAGMGFSWVRDPQQPQVWRAQSEPVQGRPLIWTLAKPARDDEGETAAWNLQWGDKHLSGSWALEHAVVDGRWAVLMPHGRAPVRGGAGTLQIWDGQRLQTVELPWPVVRLRWPDAGGAGKAPGGSSDAAAAARVQVVALVASLDAKDWEPGVGSWRWPLHSVSASHLARPDWLPLYSLREIAPDTQGRWRLLSRWREVQRIQPPWAEGDYVWHDAARGDALWWWGAAAPSEADAAQPLLRSMDGVTMTRSGLALCGTGPCACPHPAGEGWAVLVWVAAQRWELHWLNPVEKELRTLQLHAQMPRITGWDTQGLHWEEARTPGQAQSGQPERAAAQLVPLSMWARAPREPLRQSPQGLWMRKQDLRHASALLERDDSPWAR